MDRGANSTAGKLASSVPTKAQVMLFCGWRCDTCSFPLTQAAYPGPHQRGNTSVVHTQSGSWGKEEKKIKENKSQASLHLLRNIWPILPIGWIFQSHYTAFLPRWEGNGHLKPLEEQILAFIEINQLILALSDHFTTAIPGSSFTMQF